MGIGASLARLTHALGRLVTVGPALPVRKPVENRLGLKGIHQVSFHPVPLVRLRDFLRLNVYDLVFLFVQRRRKNINWLILGKVSSEL